MSISCGRAPPDFASPPLLRHQIPTLALFLPSNPTNARSVGKRPDPSRPTPERFTMWVPQGSLSWRTEPTSLAPARGGEEAWLKPHGELCHPDSGSPQLSRCPALKGRSHGQNQKHRW